MEIAPYEMKEAKGTPARPIQYSYRFFWRMGVNKANAHVRNTFAGFGGTRVRTAESSSPLSLFFIESIFSFSTTELCMYFSIALYLCH